MLRGTKMGPRMGSEFWEGRANGSPGIGIIDSWLVCALATSSAVNQSMES